MKQRLFFSILASLLLACFVQAQNTSPYWSLTGNSNATTSSKLGTTTAIPLRLTTNNTVRIHISSSLGNVGIGTTTPDNKLHVFKGSAGNVTAFSAAPLVVENSANCYISLLAPDASATGILFGKPASNLSGGIFYNDISHNTNGFDFRTNGNITQMVLNNAGNLGIGTTAPTARLQINNANNTDGIIVTNSNAAITDHQPSAVYAKSFSAPGEGYGVYGFGGLAGGYFVAFGSSGAGSAYGIFTESVGPGSGPRYGVYASASGGTVNYAGYFKGDVYTNGTYLPSARKLKDGVTPLTGGLEQLLKLKPATYQYKTAEYKDMALPEGEQMGLIAEEVKQVFPQLVKATIQPARYSEDQKTVLSPEVSFEAVNYQGLIPLLIASVQEQQRQIEKQARENRALKDELTELRRMVLELKNGPINNALTYNSAYLEQNTPNPTGGTTTIRYRVPETSTSAKLTFINAKGQIVKTISISYKGTGQVSLKSAELAAGTYHYTLWVDGKQAETKQLVVAH